MTSKLVGIIALRTERTQIHVLADVLVVVASLVKPLANGRNIVAWPTTPKNVGSRCVCLHLAKSLTGFKLNATTPNNMQQGVQTNETCNIQQCWELLANNVTSVCTGQ